MKYKKNLRIEGNKVISYVTHVATIDRDNSVLVRHGYWSMTTSKHINYVASEYGLSVVDEDDNKQRQEEPLNDHVDKAFGFMSMFLKMGDLTKKGETREEKMAYQERIVFATMKSIIPDWRKPDNWDQFSIDKKEEIIKEIRKLWL